MIQHVEPNVKTASRVWGDFAEKVAFEVDVNGANLLGAVVGGYAGNRAYNHIKDKKEQQTIQNKTIENNHYDNIQNILRDLKVVFTPINVVYSVNGQVFEIIKTSEMSPEMKERFLAKDGDYYGRLLVNKMNMELQLAEQIFARKLLQPQLDGAFKQATLVNMQLEKLAEQNVDLTVNDSFEKTASASSIKLSVSLDSLRPFSQSDFFFMEKISFENDRFTPKMVDKLSPKDMKKLVHVGFLPDRVVFLINGNLVEQMTIMQMNEEGYKAFLEKDRNFFLDFFHNESQAISSSVIKDVAEEQLPEDVFGKVSETEEEEELDKEAASLEEVLEDIDVDWVEGLATERENINLFVDEDIHPIVYDMVLDQKIGGGWHLLELEAVLKQIEVEFELTEPIGDEAFNKIAMLHTVQNEGNSTFQTSYSFEKFLRAMNNKSVLLTTFEGGMEFEEILFALDIAKSLSGDDVFVTFGKNLAPYVAEELFADNIRFVSDQVYDQDNEAENEFWTEVNDFLLRKWKDKDSYGLEDDASEKARQTTESVVDIGMVLLSQYAEYTSFDRPYDSVTEALEELNLLTNSDNKEGVSQAITQTAGRHLVGALYLDIKGREAVYMAKRLMGDDLNE